VGFKGGKARANGVAGKGVKHQGQREEKRIPEGDKGTLYLLQRRAVTTGKERSDGTARLDGSFCG
jgi:hypothetical protein